MVSYFILVVLVAVWSIVTGYGKGIMRQLGGVLGVAFGIVGVRMLAPGFIDTVNGWLPDSFQSFNRPFVCQTLCCTLIFLLIWGIICLATLPLGQLMKVFGSGVLNSIAGAIFRLFQWLLVTSLVLNLLADIYPSSDLTKTSRLHDGNIVEGVLKIAPAFLDFPDAEEVAYRQQLEDAKKIS